MTFLHLCLFAVAAFSAGIINTIAGGGSFVTLPALILCGLDPRAANITSTIALYPMQITTGYAGRSHAGGTENVRFRELFVLSLIGGIVGAILLLLTPPSFFGKLVPWLILFATFAFAWGSFFRRPSDTANVKTVFGRRGTLIVQFLISIYGGYFGGGIGILMLAALTMAHMPMRKAGATKNILAAAMNGSAVLIFLFTPGLGWQQVCVGILASVIGGQIGLRLLHKVNERKMRLAVIGWGCFLAFAMFLRG